MLTFKKSKDYRPIAIVRGGRDDGRIIYLDPNPNTEKEEQRIKSSMLDEIDEDFIRGFKKKMSINDMRNLKVSMRKEEAPTDEQLLEIYDSIVRETKSRTMREFKVHDGGIVEPLPHFNETERAYVAGPTGSGKSYFVGKYLRKLRKVFPKRTIYIFSDVNEDEVLDSIPGIIRVKLDEEALEAGPINPETLSNSICVFDDIDSIQNKKMSVMIQNLRDSLLRRGRHDNISTIVTSHLMTNYKDTRIILNECNSITFFPRSGASNGIMYTLKNYVGLNKQQITKIMDLPSRWVYCHKNFPLYIVYEKGVYLL
jgi:Cdc6-like AAA superfamily ATPase